MECWLIGVERGGGGLYYWAYRCGKAAVLTGLTGDRWPDPQACEKILFQLVS